MKQNVFELYETDVQLPGLQLLLDVEALTDRLRLWLGESESVKISIRNIRYKPETSCLVSYALETERNGSEKHVSYIHAKAFRADDWPVRKQKFSGDNALWVDDELAFVGFRFPTDLELPVLKRLVQEPDELLAQILPQTFEFESVRRMDTLAYKPNRRFATSVELDSGVRLAVKVYDTMAFDQVINTVKALKKLPQGSPRRIGKSRRHRTIVYEWLDGEALDFSALGTSQVEIVMRALFDYLDRLRAEAMPKRIDLARKTPTDGLTQIANYLSGIFPPIAGLAHQVCDRLLNSQVRNDHRLALAHGDFHERQIIVGESGVNACDFDNCCLDDASADLANFSAHLQFRMFQNEVAANVVERVDELCHEHVQHGRDRESLRSFDWNRHASMFRLATNHFRSGDSNWMEQTERYLNDLVERIAEPNSYRPSADEASGPANSQSVGPADLGLSATARCTLEIQILNDSRFSFLEEALDIQAAKRVFDQSVPQIQQIYGNYELQDIVPLRHKPGRRCLVEYRLLTDGGVRSVVGKASAKRLDRRAFEIQTALYCDHGFDRESTDGISVPRPIGCIERWRMWFQEKESACSGGLLLDENRMDGFIGRVSAATSKLHLSGYRPERRHTIADEIEILEHRLRAASAELPAEAERIDRVFRNCVEFCGRLDDQFSEKPIHRDFYQDQILLSEDRTFLVDLDLVVLGDPALDIGNFLAHLTEHAIRVHGDRAHWHELERQFAQQYVDHNTGVCWKNIIVFKALSLARHISISRQLPDRKHTTSRLIDAVECLTGQLCDGSARASSLDPRRAVNIR